MAAATLRISQEQQKAFEQKFQREFDQKLEDKNSEIKVIVNNEASQLVNEQRQQSEAQIRDLQEKLQEQQQMMKMLEEQQELFEKKLEEQKEEFYKQQRVFKEKLEEKDQQIKTLVEQQNRSHIEIRILPYYFTLSNFQDMTARDLGTSSPSMYTHSTGYKFYLLLRPNGRVVHGDGNTTITYLSVIVFSLKGDHDD